MELLKDGDIEIISDGVGDILEKIGFFCENKEIIKALESAGALADAQKEWTVKLPRAMIKRFVETLRQEDKSGWGSKLKGGNEDVIYSGYHPYTPSSGFKAPPLPYLFHNLSSFYYDDERGERRPGNSADFITLIRLADMVHPEQGAGHALNLREVPPPVEPLEAAKLLIQYSHYPRGVYIHDVRQIDYVREIQSAAGIDDPYFPWLANICCNSPLKIDRVVAERLIYMIRSGLYPIKVAAMPVAGVNMPVTVGGAVALMAAEFLMVWLIARVMGSAMPLVGMPITATMDMTSGAVNFTAFDAAARRFAVCEFIRKWTGVQLSPGPGEWTPTKTPGLYCTLEKAYFAMMAAAFTGHHPEIGVGHIDAGLSISPAQYLLDYDFTKGLRFLEPMDISRASLGLEALQDVGFGFKDNFLAHEHTISHMRSALWFPLCFSRNGYSPEIEKTALQEARKRVQDLVARHQAPEKGKDRLDQIDRIIQRAKTELCN